jgi:hypothetical protein
VNQVRANREGRATDLFLKATGLLASNEMSLRHSGVYALEQLANDDVDERFRGHSHALLTAFIRQRAPWPPDSVDTEQPAPRPMQGAPTSSAPTSPAPTWPGQICTKPTFAAPI